MVRQLAGRVHQVITAFTIVGDLDDAPVHRDGLIVTDVAVIALDEARIAGAWRRRRWRGRPVPTVKGIGAALVRRYEVRDRERDRVVASSRCSKRFTRSGAPSSKLRCRDPATTIMSTGTRCAHASMRRASEQVARR